MLSNKNRNGFTLAEVLITLLIIGVVSSIVIPSLIININKKDLEVQNKTLRSILLNAHKKIRAENGGTLDGVNYGRELAKQLNLAKNCIANHENNGCWHPPGVAKIAQRDGTFAPYANSVYDQGLLLQNGAMLRVWDGNLTCGNRTYNYPTPDCYSSVDYRAGFCTSFLADINGAKGPNIYGQDIRDLNLLNDRIVFPGDRIPGGVATWNRNTALHPNEDYDDEGDPCYDTNNWSQTQLDDVQ